MQVRIQEFWLGEGGVDFFFRSMVFGVPFWSPMGTRQHLHVGGGQEAKPPEAPEFSDFRSKKPYN